MITLNNFTKLDNGQYQMILFMKSTDSQEDLPSAARPMSPEYFAVTVDYGVPAEGSVVVKEDGEILTYSSGEWGKAETSGDIKLKELSVEENGEYVPESGYIGFDKVVVDVQPKIVMPVKGDIITIESKQYRVLKMNGSIAEALAMYNSTDSQAFDTSGNSNVYANSSLDVYLSQTFYNSLSTTMQNAIVAKTFQQDSWYYGSNSSAIAKYNGTYQTTNNYTLSLMSTTFGTSISRKCYVLSCQDIIDYLEVTTSMTAADTTLTSENIWRMFWNQTTSPGSTYPWLRSGYSQGPLSAFFVSGYDGYLNTNKINYTNAVRPAFQIDLSKIEWTKSE